MFKISSLLRVSAGDGVTTGAFVVVLSKKLIKLITRNHIFYNLITKKEGLGSVVFVHTKGF
jgi:hypothetical protein